MIAVAVLCCVRLLPARPFRRWCMSVCYRVTTAPMRIFACPLWQTFEKLYGAVGGGGAKQTKETPHHPAELEASAKAVKAGAGAQERPLTVAEELALEAAALKTGGNAKKNNKAHNRFSSMPTVGGLCMHVLALADDSLTRSRINALTRPLNRALTHCSPRPRRACPAHRR